MLAYYGDRISPHMTDTPEGFLICHDVPIARTGQQDYLYNTWYYGREVSGSAYPWCMVFVQWVFAQAGMAVPVKTASCGTLLNSAKSKGQAVYKDYQPGDVVIYDFDENGSTDHCGIVESVSGSKITSIEGNTGSGNDADGGQVQRRTRNVSSIVGAWRPPYKEVENVTVDEAKTILKNKAGLSDITIDWLSYYKYSDDLFVKLAKAMR